MYDWFLGGKDNFQVDRDAAGKLQEILPDAPKAAWANRHFLERVVHYLVGQAGIRQIIDIGAGLPTRENVHQVAQRIAPGTRVVYVDNDPVVINHGRALLATNDNVAIVESDLRTPQEIMTHSEFKKRIDFSDPVAVLMLASLHFVTDQGACKVDDCLSVSRTFAGQRRIPGWLVTAGKPWCRVGVTT